MIYGVFGGSFDPPHMSHALACLWALETGEVDRVLAIPCAQHALGKPLRASFDDRTEMCRRAFSRLSDFVEVLDLEARRSDVSYTIDTLRALTKARPGCGWRLLIGTDILGETNRWKAWAEIERIAPPLVVPRLTGQRDATSGSGIGPEGDLRLLSSSHLRARMELGQTPIGLIPASVLEYIREKKLYGPGD